ncbi:MAG: DUF4280 domain-containing protein [Clostridium beijerinckii]|uniref:DUF4280 domain-containing protein n=1 Tax=Clostridium beijerinckii TaxID=1520 RepID=UPI00031A34D1|nr:DUF4280 domain-containing protein [Clostridium beijerinckii]MCI1477823.1 DUF4280 domain-containing protein [Clostridium beijerinckii]MCI1577861.1 DUF4280 domain-containing protein [Clostridium beijerinckii]MCI1583573.1 DUF4280 domain-containing protein [Clostridium beijerinckii]MCI1620728.1 DUF4280 domain-containing protein [Clostridium beijerinckii]
MAQAYIVRGAKMKCDKGTHKRKINLPVSHGAYSNGNPIMNEGDNVVGKNISDFGICKGSCPSSGNITLTKEKGGSVTGKKCQIKILKEWMNTKEDTIVDGLPALTTDSVLICAYGGKIKFVTDGQA